MEVRGWSGAGWWQGSPDTLPLCLHALERLEVVGVVGLLNAKRYLGLVAGVVCRALPKALTALRALRQLGNEVVQDVEVIEEDLAQKFGCNLRDADQIFEILVLRHKPVHGEMRPVLTDEEH